MESDMSVGSSNLETALQVSEAATCFISEHGLEGMVKEFRDALGALAHSGYPIVDLVVDIDDVDPEPDRLLLSVGIHGDMASAYEAWKEIRPVVTPVVREAEADGLVSLEFSPRRA
jgi:hypothetical protein